MCYFVFNFTACTEVSAKVRFFTSVSEAEKSPVLKNPGPAYLDARVLHSNPRLDSAVVQMKIKKQ